MKPSCYNREPFSDTVTVQDGWLMDRLMRLDDENHLQTRLPRMVTIPDQMSKGCASIKPPFGEAIVQGWDCSGCRWTA